MLKLLSLNKDQREGITFLALFILGLLGWGVEIFTMWVELFSDIQTAAISTTLLNSVALAFITAIFGTPMAFLLVMGLGFLGILDNRSANE